jgi:hypothetical protein
VDSEPTRGRPFGIQTNLIHVRSDCACLIEIDMPPVSEDMDGWAYQYFVVTPGATLTVIEDALAHAPRACNEET